MVVLWDKAILAAAIIPTAGRPCRRVWHFMRQLPAVVLFTPSADNPSATLTVHRGLAFHLVISCVLVCFGA
jgi:hypothetical protein